MEQSTELIRYEKISNNYYARLFQKGIAYIFTLIPEAKEVKLKPDYLKEHCFFVYTAEDRWFLVHAATGASIAMGELTRAKAIQAANERLAARDSEYFTYVVNHNILKFGLSPQFKLTETKTPPTDAELLDFAMLEMARQLTRKKQ